MNQPKSFMASLILFFSMLLTNTGIAYAVDLCPSKDGLKGSSFQKYQQETKVICEYEFGPNETQLTATANCPKGAAIIYGGYSINDNSGSINISENRVVQTTAAHWSNTMQFNRSASNAGESVKIEIDALCEGLYEPAERLLSCFVKYAGEFKEDYGNIPKKSPVEIQIKFTVDHARDSMPENDSHGSYFPLEYRDHYIRLVVLEYTPLSIGGQIGDDVPSKAYSRSIYRVGVDRTRVTFTAEDDDLEDIGTIPQSSSNALTTALVSSNGNLLNDRVPDSNDTWKSLLHDSSNTTLTSISTSSNIAIPMILPTRLLESKCNYED